MTLQKGPRFQRNQIQLRTPRIVPPTARMMRMIAATFSPVPQPCSEARHGVVVDSSPNACDISPMIQCFYPYFGLVHTEPPL